MSTHKHLSDHSSQGSEVIDVAHSHHIIEPYVYYRVFAILVVLFIATVAVAFFDLSKMLNWPPANLVVALAIAMCKAAVIVMYFMHVKYASRLTQVFAVSAMLWLMLMFAFTFADYFTRSWSPQPGSWTTPGGG